MNKTDTKYALKSLFSNEEDYLKFMADFTGGIMTTMDIIKKYNLQITSRTLAKYADRLGYRSFRTKQLLRGQYKVMERVKRREETMSMMLNLLKKRALS